MNEDPTGSGYFRILVTQTNFMTEKKIPVTVGSGIAFFFKVGSESINLKTRMKRVIELTQVRAT